MPIARGVFPKDIILRQGREKLHPQPLDPEPDQTDPHPDRSWRLSFQIQSKLLSFHRIPYVAGVSASLQIKNMV